MKCRVARGARVHPGPVRYGDQIKLPCFCQAEAFYWNMPICLNSNRFLTMPRSLSARGPTGKARNNRPAGRPHPAARCGGKQLSGRRLQGLEQRHPGDYAQRYDTDRDNRANQTSDTDIAERTCCRAHPAAPPKSCCISSKLPNIGPAVTRVFGSQCERQRRAYTRLAGCQSDEIRPRLSRKANQSEYPEIPIHSIGTPATPGPRQRARSAISALSLRVLPTRAKPARRDDARGYSPRSRC